MRTKIFIVSVILSLFSAIGYSQSNLTFQDDNIAFEYPSKFKERATSNPGIVFKTESNGTEFLVVRYPGSIIDGIDGWSTVIHKLILGHINEWQMNLIDMQNTHLSESSMIRCSKYWANKDSSKIVLYAFVANNTIYLVWVSSPGNFLEGKYNTTIPEDNLVSKIRTINPEYDIVSQLNKNCLVVNEKSPFLIDDVTCYMAAYVDKKKCIYKVRIYDEDDYAFNRTKAIVGIAKAFKKDSLLFLKMKEQGFSFIYSCYNSLNVPLGAYEVTAEEILNYIEE